MHLHEGRNRFRGICRRLDCANRRTCCDTLCLPSNDMGRFFTSAPGTTSFLSVFAVTTASSPRREMPLTPPSRPTYVFTTNKIGLERLITQEPLALPEHRFLFFCGAIIFRCTSYRFGVRFLPEHTLRFLLFQWRLIFFSIGAFCFSWYEVV